MDTDENVRGFLGRDAEGRKRKSTLANLATRETLENNRTDFPILNSGVVIVAREADVEDSKRQVIIQGASIIHGVQTKGVLEDYFDSNPYDGDYPSVSFELIVADDLGVRSE